jgi:hypothetical protein
MISSCSRAKKLESLVIDYQRGPAQRLCADSRKPDRVLRRRAPHHGDLGGPIFPAEVTNGVEGSTTCRPVADDSRRLDLGAPRLGPVDIDQADVLVRDRMRISTRGLVTREWDKRFPACGLGQRVGA